jgi:hypothetical protein
MSQSHLHIARPESGWTASPLDRLTITAGRGARVIACDGVGQEYFSAPAAAEVTLIVGGALGTHTVRAVDATGAVLDELRFEVDALTRLDDEGGRFHELLGVLNHTMRCYTPSGEASLDWRGKTYRNFVSWMLDHVHTAKGMQYFSDATGGWVELWRDGQLEDGMCWSFAWADRGPGYYDTAYGPAGYARRVDGALFTRQPVENHNEYNFVECAHLAWKGSGDDAWMKAVLDACIKALDYSMHDPARWSSRFGLLKRGYTIDSWDFQVHDQHTIEFRLATEQMIDPQRTKFGVFFGDNHGYAHACDCLAEMLEHARRTGEADRFRQRSRDIRRRLDSLTWNGAFFTHHVEEDDSIKRDLGVDEASQIAMSNAYALNRGILHEQAVPILKTYLDLRANLPAGSPGEWYSIYPPFGRGFGRDSGKWQYMNAGVHGHAAGELARGAFEHGFEQYGADILERLRELAKVSGGMVRFAWTGAVEPPPAPQKFTPVDLVASANMDLWDKGSATAAGWMRGGDGNDMRNLPTGRQELAGAPWRIADPAANDRRAVIAVARRDGWPEQIIVPVDNAKAGAIYLVHTVNSLGPSKVAGVMSLRYEDGSEHSTYIQAGTHITGWWFPELKATDAGVAWRGPNPRSNDVGVCWAALANPHPDKPIRQLEFSAARDGAIYAVLGLTLADRPPYHAPELVSHGGPDNWSGGLCVAALIEGLAGVRDRATAMADVRLSPRWTAAGILRVSIVVRYPASKGYVAYEYMHHAAERRIELLITGSGRQLDLRVLLPTGAQSATAATVDGRNVAVMTESVEQSLYATLPIALAATTRVDIQYR